MPRPGYSPQQLTAIQQAYACQRAARNLGPHCKWRKSRARKSKIRHKIVRETPTPDGAGVTITVLGQGKTFREAMGKAIRYLSATNTLPSEIANLTDRDLFPPDVT